MWYAEHSGPEGSVSGLYSGSARIESRPGTDYLDYGFCDFI
jgi:hypothetical protein